MGRAYVFFHAGGRADRLRTINSVRTNCAVHAGALNSLRRRLTKWTDQIWTIERRARLLDARSEIYSLLDRNCSAFYDIPKAEPTVNEANEFSALVKQLRVIADTIRRNTGMRPERLDAMIAVQAQKVG